MAEALFNRIGNGFIPIILNYSTNINCNKVQKYCIKCGEIHTPNNRMCIKCGKSLKVLRGFKK